jgi:transitional endoplasmic reticulum ATPase
MESKKEAPVIGEKKKDYSTAILERKKAPNRLMCDDSLNDDNSAV